MGTLKYNNIINNNSSCFHELSIHLTGTINHDPLYRLAIMLSSIFGTYADDKAAEALGSGSTLGLA